jgi:hypothetical protein
MRRSAWMVVAAFLGFSAIAVIGCGSKSEPNKADVSINAETSSSIAAPKVEEVKLVHEMDAARHVLQTGSTRAAIGGTSSPMEALIEDEYLVFRTVNNGMTPPENEFRLKLGSNADPHSFESKKLTIRPEMPSGPQVPEILVRGAKDNLRLFPNGYALTLELGTRQNWKLPGNIYLCLPDEEKTVLAGSFLAAFPRQPTEPPGPEDLPYIQGSVSVVGAPPTTLLRVGYIVDQSPGVFDMGSADLTLAELATSVGWLRNDTYKPRVTMLLPGDGKTISCRYEHSKLTTGRYLVFASLPPNGPISWKWLAVLPGEAHTIDLAIDAARTGGIEVIAPPEAVKTVEMAPADKPGFHAMDRGMFTACVFQFGLSQAIISRKAVFKNLAPGRYEVRAAGQTRTVEIVAGKTIELDFNKTEKIPTIPEPAPEPRPKQ